MPKAITPRWQDLIDVLEVAEERITLFAPYFSESGIEIVQRSAPMVDVLFWSRMALEDWARGFAAPEPLLAYMRLVGEGGKSALLRVQPKLHAKAYIADASTALLGSSNLTSGGFANNIEVMIRLEADDAADALQTLTIAAEPNSRLLTADDLDRWVRQYRETVRRAIENADSISDVLADAQAESDEALGLTLTSGPEPNADSLNRFVEWLAENRQYPGAAYLVELHEDRVIQRRQGHVKQCFAAVYRFLHENTPWIQRLAVAVTDGDGLYEPDPQLLESWSQHLEEHATDQNELYSYDTLRSILRPSLGGVLAGAGGGASGTLKRMLPLVAKYISDAE